MRDTSPDASVTSSTRSRLGHLEQQQQQHAAARQSQARRSFPFPLNFAAKSDELPVAGSTNAAEQSPAGSTRQGSKTDGPADGPLENMPHPGGGDDGDDETELNAELVSEEEASARSIASLLRSALIDLFIVLPIFLLPSLFVFMLLQFHVYDLIVHKGPAGLNASMEFIRYNVFFGIAYGLYVMTDLLSLALPELIILFTQPGDSRSAKFIRRQMRHLIAIRGNVAMFVWLATLLFLAGVLLYRSMFVTPMELVTKLLEAKQQTAIAASDAATVNSAIAAEATAMLHRHGEMLLTVLTIFAGVIAVEKYLMKMVALSFHRGAFSARISESNARFVNLSCLYEAVTRGKPRVLSSHRPTIHSIDSYADLSFDASMNLHSAHRARSVARTIFRSVLAEDAGRDHLLPEDLERWVQNPDEAFRLLDGSGSGQLTAHELEEQIVDICMTRHCLYQSLRANGRIVGKLDTIFVVFALILGGVLVSPVFDIGMGRVWATLGVVSAGLGFMFQGTAKTCFESLIFVFIEHPFDVGDRVSIDEEHFVVEDIEVFTTRLVRWDGVLVYISNATLAAKSIHNIRRSENQCERVAISLAGDTTTESLWAFRDALTLKLQADPQVYTGFMDLADLDRLPVEAAKLPLSVIVQMRGNFQNPAKRNAHKTDLLDKIDASLRECNIAKA